jgi:uncharacterized membrane protein YqaE (UPF0057 family)
MGIFDDILRVILFPLEPIIDPVIQLVNAILLMVNFIVELVKMIPKLLTVFFYILDPVGFLNDLMFGMTEGVTMVFEALIDVLFRDVRNTMGKKDPGSNDGQGHKKVCASPSLVETIILVICPPLFIVLRQGLLTGFFPTVICFVLTYLFYVPGLVYASLYYAC